MTYRSFSITVIKWSTIACNHINGFGDNYYACDPQRLRGYQYSADYCELPSYQNLGTLQVDINFIRAIFAYRQESPKTFQNLCQRTLA